MNRRSSKKKLKRKAKRNFDVVLHLSGEISLSTKTVESKKTYKRNVKHKRKEYV